VKEPHYFLRISVDPGDVWPFEGITVQTAVGQILQNSRPTMLFSNDMIDLEWQGRQSVGQMAVLA